MIMGLDTDIIINGIIICKIIILIVLIILYLKYNNIDFKVSVIIPTYNRGNLIIKINLCLNFFLKW